MIIYASLELHGNISTVNHLWQAGPMSENTRMMHSVGPSSPNVKSMGSLDFPFREGQSDKKFFSNTEKCPRNIEHSELGCQMLAYILGGLSGFGTGIVLGRRSPDLTKIASIVPSSTGSTSLRAARHLS
ncbi:hypothetical protein OIU85_003118 [Salix viminalis]|uniref:AIR12 DOMON domain-containing protein n=1 Tax=Salix viminalis TaxID=40686 RepID=A0A9Q0PYS8_SALVM|nr:hypothetical protein OIU85_003118 [Salix viminalis]